MRQTYIAVGTFEYVTAGIALGKGIKPATIQEKHYLLALFESVCDCFQERWS